MQWQILIIMHANALSNAPGKIDEKGDTKSDQLVVVQSYCRKKS